MRIAVASGKGGTGKTTVSVNLALAADQPVQLLDCDVEEPNVHLFLKGTDEQTSKVSILIPEIIEDRCTAADGCDLCSEFCEFGAIACLGSIPMVMADMCHGCGGCKRACKQKAIREVPYSIGTIRQSRFDHILLIEGKMDIGMSLSSTIIDRAKEGIDDTALAILDSPPGTACPAVATMKGCDFAVLTTEPTPFGLNDLKLAVDMTRALCVPFGVVINRVEKHYDCINRYCTQEGIDILAEIPDDRRIAESYANGIPIIKALPEYKALFGALLNQIKEYAT
ncbi:ATP-binding protein [uncultured Cohaesibacter sp.]|uniref:ATP-binding protein n=1 Tax=uncultured Cohaesibacter sp. TaxID=1002546 RepID=UPI0029C81973|nr:ATP-binding protein [uncultured Cohaesibacter sp.]